MTSVESDAKSLYNVQFNILRFLLQDKKKIRIMIRKKNINISFENEEAKDKFYIEKIIKS